MLLYRVHQIHLEGLDRYYLPLPKLNTSQLSYLSQNLQNRGFRVKVGPRLLRASASSINLSVDPGGLSWSSKEVLDAITPAIPRLLAFPRETVAGGPLDKHLLYFRAKRVRGRKYDVHLFTRMESLHTWTELRKEGLCGLTPDEKKVIGSLLASAEGTVECLTDYVSEDSSPVQFERRQYYRSTIPVAEFLSTLRSVSEASKRNSYLPRESILRVTLDETTAQPSLDGLDEWCYLS
ncbi:MAG: hypothetical protein OK456_06340 [Thaumarchaeota archaeon]|nr:hypothetical protein [Nitrososphaerota archaeon]